MLFHKDIFRLTSQKCQCHECSGFIEIVLNVIARQLSYYHHTRPNNTAMNNILMVIRRIYRSNFKVYNILSRKIRPPKELKWGDHINKITSKVNMTLDVLRRNIKTDNTEVKT